MNKVKSKIKREEVEKKDIVKTKEVKKKIVKPYDGKYKVTFLANQMFKGLYRPKGTSMEVQAHIEKAYKGRTTLKFEQLK